MESEIQLYAGSAQQVALQGYSTVVGERWGDYSAMMLDPDDCTFWYTGEYLKQVGSFNWSTRVLSFSFPSCTSPASITLPIPNSEGGTALTSGTATFYWTSGSGSPTGYTLSVGGTQGASNYCSGPQSYSAGTYSATLACLPTDGSTFWVRLAAVGGVGGFQDYQYTSPTLIQSQTITFTTPPPSSAVYGSTFTVAATASSGLPVTFTSAGACTNSGATYQMTSGTGTCSVIANQAGNSQYSPAPTVTDSVSATQAVLTVSANNASMNYGDPAFPTFSANITGYVNGDGSGVVSGSPSFNTNASLSSVPGQYTIFVTQGTLAAANYTFTFINAFLTINQASSSSSLQANPTTIGTGDTTTLTVTVTGSPNGAAPSGTVTFFNGATQLGTGTLSSGNGPEKKRVLTAAILAKSKKVLGGPEHPGLANIATLQVSGLPLGNNNITATYGGDSNYVGGSSQSVTVNVVQPGLYSPAPGSTLTSNTATFSWYGAAGATAYWIDLGAAPGANTYYQSGSLPTTTESVTVNSLPTDGSTIYVTLYYLINGAWQSNPYTYTAFGGSATKGTMTSPTPGSTLTGSTVTFTWNAGSASTAYWLDAGNVAGGNQYYQSGNLGNVLTTTVTTLPTDGTTVYVTLYSMVNGQWVSNAYTYTAYNVASADGVITSPTPGSTLTGSSVTFQWAPGSGATSYWLDAGSTPGGNQYEQSGALGNVTQLTVNGLPTDGSTIYVTLYSLVGGVWSGNSYTYTALNGTGNLAQITTPTPGSSLSGTTATFDWTVDGNATAYWLDIGNVPGGNQYYQSGNLGNVQTTTVYSLPADGSTIYVTLYSYVGGQWLSNSYTYTSNP
jgi:hypothetical protein